MKQNTRLMFLTPILVALLSGWCGKPDDPPKVPTPTPTPTPQVVKTTAPPRAVVNTEKEVTFFPGYGYRDGKNWKVHLRGWAHKPRTPAGPFVALFAQIKGMCGNLGTKNLEARAADFYADDKSLEAVAVKFDSDPENKNYSLKISGIDGIVEKDLVLTDDQAKQLLDKQHSANGWLTYHAVSKEHTGLGRIRLIESDPNGISLISDIDDTIRVTGVPAGKDTVVKNVFCDEFKPLPNMEERYRALGDIPVHYVSGGPEQLFGKIYDSFIATGIFPEGTFHLRFLPKPVLLREAARSVMKLGTGTMNGTLDHKLKQVRILMDRFPDRKFILSGDSGEVDPEVYSQIRKERPAQVKEIWIRDVINDKATNDFRLGGMQVIEVTPPVCVENEHFTNLSAMIKKSYPTVEYKRNTAAPCK